MMPKRWTVLRKREWDQDHYTDFGEPFLAVYDIKRPDVILWDGGPNYCMVEPAHVQIVHTYAYSVQNDYDRPWIEFYKVYKKLQSQPESAPAQTPGWMAPDGTFYPCDYDSHGALARRISAILYNSLDGDVLIEKRGWMRIESEGEIHTLGWGNERDRRLTLAQEATMMRLSMVGSQEWKINMIKNVELYGEQQ